MKTVSNTQSLYTELLDLNKDDSKKIIMVDGWTGVGKSTKIIPVVAKATNWEIVDGDSEFLTPKTGIYTYNKDKILDVFNKRSKIIIDSILCLEIARIAKIIPDILIYVKGVNKNNEWIHSHIVDPKSDVNKLVDYYSSGLEKQLIYYHRKFKPNNIADITIENYDPFNDNYSIIPQMFFD